MARDTITVQEPVLDATKSVASGKITAQAVTVANGIEIENAVENKDNSLQITVINTGAKKAVTFKAGDVYPNACLGDLSIDVDGSATTVFLLHDISRFERKDKSVYVDFETGFTGSIYAVAKHAGIRKLS